MTLPSGVVEVPTIDWDAKRCCSSCLEWKRPPQFKTYTICRKCASPRARSSTSRKQRTPRGPHGTRSIAIAQNRAWVNAHKQEKGCAQCLEHDPCCLDLHHEDPSSKEKSIAVLVLEASLEEVQAEAAKCIVLCSNCHRKLHHWIHRHAQSSLLKQLRTSRGDPATFRKWAAEIYRQCFGVLDHIGEQLQSLLLSLRGMIRFSDALLLAGFEKPTPRGDLLVGRAMQQLGWQRARRWIDGKRAYVYMRGAVLEREVVIRVEREDDGLWVVKQREP